MPPGTHVYSDSDLESIISPPAKLRRNSTGPKYCCSIDGCNASFKRLDALDRHEYHHTGIKKHACIYDDCTKSYSIVTHLKRHIRTTHERCENRASQRNVQCELDGCYKMFHSVCNMQRHIREVHENPKVYRCMHCAEEFTQKLKMRRHEIISHTGDYPFSCDKCSRGFITAWQQQRHIASCKIYPCTNCELQFEKWSLYQKHCKETQHGRKYYKCEHCARIYNKPSDLQRHVVAQHLNDDKQMGYKCTYEGCMRLYVYERNLKQHILTAHTGRRFECKEGGCERFFSSGQNLSKHIEREHRQKIAVEQNKVANKLKRKRKRRKDAGTPLLSNLAKLSGLLVDKQFDRLLRAREENALSVATAALEQETTIIKGELFENTNKTSDINLKSLIAIALQDDE